MWQPQLQVKMDIFFQVYTGSILFVSKVVILHACALKGIKYLCMGIDISSLHVA